MSKKRIRVSQAFVNKLDNYKQKDIRSKLMCSKFLYREQSEPTDSYIFRIYVRARIPVYIFLLPFVLLIEFFYCIWDGGLKSFKWPSPVVENRRISSVPYPSEYLSCTNEWERQTHGL